MNVNFQNLKTKFSRIENTSLKELVASMNLLTSWLMDRLQLLRTSLIIQIKMFSAPHLCSPLSIPGYYWQISLRDLIPGIRPHFVRYLEASGCSLALMINSTLIPRSLSLQRDYKT